MRGYKHLRLEAREKIAQLLRSETPISEIARQLGVSGSTVSREIARNKNVDGSYVPEVAQNKTLKRRQREGRLYRNRALADFIKNKLTHHYWSPEQISGYLRVNDMKFASMSHETIYQWIYSKEQRKEKLWKFLPRHKSKRGMRHSRGKRGSRIPHRVSVHERPDIKGQFGNWEGDLMSFQKNSQHILVIRERVSMLTFSCVLENKTTTEVIKRLEELIEPIPKNCLKTFTFDNGTEFSDHHKLGIKTYFCDPYSPWQKGGVENTNGRLRRDLPRWLDVKNMDEDDFDEIIENYNTTPRKTLGFQTPLTVFQKNLQIVALHT